MLRAARQAQGLHIAALAASMKVPQAKLEALEAERFGELPDPTFTRALAQSVCRALKIDAAPVLARLPSAGPQALDKVEGGLNMPFRDRPGRGDPIDRLWLRHPVTWLVAVLLLGALAVSFVPTEWLRSLSRTNSPVAAQSAGVGSPVTTASEANTAPPTSPASVMPGERTDVASLAAPEAPAATTVASVPASAALPAVAVPAQASASAGAGAAVQLRAIDASWIQVSDPGGRVLFSRVVAAGETVGLEAAPPLKIRVGNARGTEIRLHGQLVDLSSSTRDNIANVDLR
jgi:cytoskeleton protein RodZ